MRVGGAAGPYFHRRLSSRRKRRLNKYRRTFLSRSHRSLYLQGVISRPCSRRSLLSNLQRRRQLPLCSTRLLRENNMLPIPFIRAFLWPLFAAIVLVSFAMPRMAQAVDPMPVTGYAWSSYIGWISFNGTGYGVLEDPTTGALSGYAWSSNFGWISFNASDASHPPPNVDFDTGKISGWIRACAAFADKNACSGTLDNNSGGWDGWIALSGVAADQSSYGIVQGSSTCAWTGYAWGSDAIGAISASGVASDGSSYGVGVDPAACGPTATLSASPSTIDSGQSSTLTWSSANADSCTGTGFTADGTSGTRSTGILNSPGTSNYQVACTGAGGTSAPAFASVEVLSPNVVISASPARLQIGANSQISWSASGVKSCTVTGPSGTLASGNADASHNFSTGSPISVAIQYQSIFTITCQTNGAPATKSVTVNVVPLFQEF